MKRHLVYLTALLLVLLIAILFYVALTRAKDRLHVAAVRERYHRKTDVSRFVEEAGL